MAETNIGQSDTKATLQEVPPLEDLKKLFLEIRQSYEKNLEADAPLVQFTDLVHLLKNKFGNAPAAAPTDAEDAAEALLKDDQAKYIFEELIPGVVKRICAIITKNMTFAAMICDALSACAALFTAMLQLDGSNTHDRTTDMADAMKIVFDPTQKFYQHHFLNELGGDAGKAQAVNSDMQKYSDEEQKWRENLKVDDEVDAWKEDTEFGIKEWARGRVVACFHYPATGKLATVRVKFVNDITVSEMGVTIDSEKMAPPGTKRENDEWRGKLKKGDVVDAKDRCNSWYEATVIAGEEREAPLFPSIKIGFRQYHVQGSKSDDMGNYFGFSSAADEHIGSYTVRIQKPYTYSKKSSLSQSKTESKPTDPTPSSGVSLFNQHQDEQDLKMLENEKDIIFTTERSRCKSTFFIQMMNQFGNDQGFLKILSTINNESTTVDLTYYLVIALGALSENLHKSFVDSYLVSLKDAVEAKILNSNESQLRLFRRERIEELINTVWDRLMARLLSFFDAQVQKNILNMNIGVLYLRQKFLERRIDGAKLIDFVCKQALANTNSTSDLNKQLVDELTKHNVLDEFFSKERCHGQLVSRSEGLLKLLIKEKAMKPEQLEMVWQSCRSDESIMIDLYKVLAEVAGVNTPEMQFFVEKIISQKVGSVRTQEIDLLASISQKMQAAMKSESSVVISVLEFFWKNIFDPNHECNEIVWTKVTGAFSDVLRGIIDKDIVYEYTKKLVENLHKSQNFGFVTIKILSKYVEDYVERTGELQNPLPEKKKDFIEHIEKEYNLLDAIFTSLRSYMHTVKTCFLDYYTQDMIDAIGEKEIFGKKESPHIDHLKSRLQLIGSMIEQSQSIMKLSHLEMLWDILITTNRIHYDHQLAYKFMRKMCDAVIQNKIELIAEDKLIEFITQKISEQTNFENLSMEGYYFFQSFFILMNSRAHRLILLGDDGQQSSQKMTSYNNQTGATYKQYKFNQNDSTSVSDSVQVEVMVKAPPNEMEHIQGLWKIAIDCKDAQIGESVTSLLLQLHTNLDFGMEEMIPQFEDQFVSSCLKIIREQSAVIRQRSAEEQGAILKRLADIKGYYVKTQTLNLLPVEEKRIRKCQKYIKMLIKNSEKDGTHLLRPHSALVQGEWLGSITINNSFRVGNGYRSKFTMQCFSNVTLYEFKSMVAFQLAQWTNPQGSVVMETPAHPQTISISRYSSSSSLKDSENGSTLAELNFRSSETLTITKKSQYAASKVPLINEEGTDINARATFIFDQMFHTYAIDDPESPGTKIMRIDEVCQFIMGATNETCDKSDSRAINILNNHDSNKDGKLERDDFIEFYRQSCFQKIHTVRQNLFKYNYNQQLRLMPKDGEDDNILQPRKTINEMPRYKIANDNEAINTLFSLLDFHKEVQSETQSLINALCTKPAMFWDMLWMDERPKDFDHVDWRESLKDSNMHKIGYTLQILDSFITSDLSHFSPQSYEFKFREKWTSKFLEQGGFALLMNLLQKVLDQMDFKNEMIVNLLDHLLRLIQIFINAAIQSDMSEEERTQKLQAMIQETQAAEKPATTSTSTTTSGVNTDTSVNNSTVTVPFTANQDLNSEINKYNAPDSMVSGPQLPPNLVSSEVQASDITQEALFPTSKVDQDGNQVTSGSSTTAASTQVATSSSEAKTFEMSAKFTQIVNSIRDNDYQPLIYSALDFETLQKMLLNIISRLNTRVSKKEENSIMANGMDLWLCLLQKQPDLIDKFYEWQGEPIPVDEETTKDNKEEIKEPTVVTAKDFIKSGIYSSKAESVRQVYKKAIELIAEKVESPKGTSPLFWLLDLMMNSFPTQVTVENKDKPDKTSRCNEFFGLFTKLVQQVQKQENTQAFNLRETISLAIHRMKSHVSNEKGSFIDDDRTLVGYMTLVYELLCMYIPLNSYEDLIALETEHQLINEMFYQNIYYVPGKTKSESQNKCRGRNSRTAAYRLMLKIVKALKPKELVGFLGDDLLPLIQDLPKPEKWLHQPSNKSRYMYSGIVNLGCICYMISMLQQLYMVPQFRYLLLKAVDTTDVVMDEWKGRKIHDNLLVQFQRLFGFLEMTERNAYDAIDFIFAYKQDGKPTNVAIQCDCQEFLVSFFDRIETMLKPTTQKHLVNDFFSFKINKQMVCSKCGNTKSRLEIFNNLQCEVENKTTLYESLNKLTEAQEIQDYRCEACDQKVDLIQRTMVGDTPNVLFVHLQRIVYSFNTWSNQKINTKLEFPQILNLKPYTVKGIAEKEGKKDQWAKIDELAPYLEIDDDNFIYKLVGVTVHQGTADHGHYYSIINTARGKDEKDPYEKEEDWLAVEKDSWKEFNDDEVKYFSFKDLAKETYGNEVTNFAQKEQGSGKSAYMLVYERKKKTDIRQVQIETQSKDESTVSLKEVGKYMPDWLKNQVQKDNIDFVIDRQVFDDNFFIMVKQIMEHVASQHVVKQHEYKPDYYQWFDKLKELSLTIGQRVTFDFLSHFNEKKQLGPITDALGSVMTFTESYVNYCSTSRPTTMLVDFIKKHYLADGCKNFFELMFLCSDSSTRMYIARLTAKLVNRCFVIHGLCSENPKDAGCERLQVLYKTLDELMGFLMRKLMDTECHKNWSRLNNYFTLLLDIAQGGKYQTMYMLKNYNFVVDICDIMLQDKSPKVALETEKRVTMGGSVSTTPFGPLVQLMSHLVRSMHTSQMLKVPNGGIYLSTHTTFANEKDSKQPKMPLEEHIPISDELIEYLTNMDLFRIVMNNQYSEEHFGKALAHICFDNAKLSKQICLRLLKIIVASEYDKVKPCIEIVNTLLTIRDHADPTLQRKRLEWVLGFGFLKWTQKDDFKISVGLETAFHNVKEEIYMMKSMLTYDPDNDNALLHLLWRYHGRMDQYTINCLDDLTRVMMEDEGIRAFLAEQPGPTYQYARFTDWIKPYLEAQFKNSNASSYNDTYHTSIRATATRVLSQYETYEKSLRQIDGQPEPVAAQSEAKTEPQQEQQEEAKVIKLNPKSFVILKQGTNENFFSDVIDKDDVYLSISYVDCDYVWSQPNGQTNLALGPKYLTKYNSSSTYSTTYGPPTASQSAASMLRERDNQVAGTTRPNLSNEDEIAKETAEIKQDQQVIDLTKDEPQQPQSHGEPQAPATSMTDDSFEDWDGAEIMHCQDLVYKFTLNNSTQEPIMFKIKLSEKAGKTANLNWPRTGIKGQLDVGETKVVCVLTKTRPDAAALSDGLLEIEKLNITLDWKLNEDKLKQIANQAKQSERSGSSKMGAAVRFDEKVNTVNATETEVKTDGVPVEGKADYFQDYFQGSTPGGEVQTNAFEKQCGACTVINPAESSVCYLCQTPF